MPKVETFNRQQVLHNATEVFHKKGYNGTSMQDLVDATSLNRSSIYNSFGSKLGIFMDVLSYYHATYKRQIGKKVVSSHNASDTLNGIFDIYINDILNDNDEKGCLILNSKSEMTNQDLTIKTFIEENQEQTLALLEDIVYNGQMEKIFNKNQTPSQYALYLFTGIQGFRMTGILNKNQDDLKNLAQTIIKVLY